MIDYIIIGISSLFMLMGFICGFKRKLMRKTLMFGSLVSAVVFTKPISSYLNEILNDTYSNWLVIGMSFILCLVISWLSIKLLLEFIKWISGDEGKSLIDRLIGAILGLVKAFIFTNLVMMLLIGFTYVIPEVQVFLTVDLHLESEQFSIGKRMYEFAYQILSYMI